MRLIDADALKKDDELTEWKTRDAIRTGKMLKTFSELFIKKIDECPTVCDIEQYAKEHNLFICTTNIIEQIREEIEREADHYDAYVDQDIAKGLYYAGEIIDKYLNGGMSPEVKEHYEQLAEHYNKKGKKG